MKKTAIITISTIIAIIILIAIAGMYKFNYLANQEGYDVDGNKIINTNIDMENKQEMIPVEPNN